MPEDEPEMATIPMRSLAIITLWAAFGLMRSVPGLGDMLPMPGDPDELRDVINAIDIEEALNRVRKV